MSYRNKLWLSGVIILLCIVLGYWFIPSQQKTSGAENPPVHVQHQRLADNDVEEPTLPNVIHTNYLVIDPYTVIRIPVGYEFAIDCGYAPLEIVTNLNTLEGIPTHVGGDHLGDVSQVIYRVLPGYEPRFATVRCTFKKIKSSRQRS